MTTEANALAFEHLLQQLPSNSEVQLQYLRYGVREVTGSLCGIDSTGDRSRVVVEEQGERHSANLRSVESVRFPLQPSSEQTDRVLEGLPDRANVFVETRSGEPMHGAYAGLQQQPTRSIRLDRPGGRTDVAVDDILAISFHPL
jgi:hypothetical protein